MTEEKVLGVIGGSGLYNMYGLENVQTLDLDTPFGKPSAPIVMGMISGRKLAFLARHGIGHHIMPSEVNYRANIYAMKSVGVDRLVSISACGSLRDDYAPGHIVIPDQIFDFTHKRDRTFFGDGLVAHVGTANPFCHDLSDQVYQAVSEASANQNEGNVQVHQGGTLITIEGPRFSTKAESNLYRAWGMSLIGMTACPEVFLAREAEICYCIMAHVTDYDVWHTSEQPVSVEMVIRTLLQNTEVAQQSIQVLARNLQEEHLCTCDSALENTIITQRDVINPETRERLGVLVKKYF